VQDEDEAVAAPSVQVAPGLENVPVPPVVNVTVPLGADFVPRSVSVVVAVQTEESLSATAPGAQDTTVDVERLFTVTSKSSPLV
jgi:hypothetical protein